MKPCPFCGGAPQTVYVSQDGYGAAYVRCSECGARGAESRGSYQDATRQAERAWDMRK